jgi:hypothetical protein
VLDLDQIILAGSGNGAASQIYADAAAEQLQTSTFAREVHTTAVSLSTMGADAAALGGSSLVLHSHLTPPPAEPTKWETSCRWSLSSSTSTTMTPGASAAALSYSVPGRQAYGHRRHLAG